MIVFHNGKKPPLYPEAIETGDSRWITVTWERELSDTEVINVSSWILPTGFSISTFMNNVSSQQKEGCKVYTKSIRVLLSTTAAQGRYEIGNTVSTSQSQTITNTFLIDVI
jgi:hypothetical protein